MANPYQIRMPRSARKRVVNRHEDGRAEKVENLVGQKVVGIRIFSETGDIEYEYGLKAGKRHEVKYLWDDPGKLCFSEPFVNGLRHGTAHQWDRRGRIVGTYKMVRGTGLDLWWQWRTSDNSPYLAEALFCKDGLHDGFEWWINEDQQSVYIERHWQAGDLHGVHREWSTGKSLDRGYPKFLVHDNQVSKRAYIKASKSDPTLPPFQLEDDKPRRDFPSEVARHLRLRRRR